MTTNFPWNEWPLDKMVMSLFLVHRQLHLDDLKTKLQNYDYLGLLEVLERLTERNIITAEGDGNFSIIDSETTSELRTNLLKELIPILENELESIAKLSNWQEAIDRLSILERLWKQVLENQLYVMYVAVRNAVYKKVKETYHKNPA